jgi:hypothetical protein
MFMRALAAITLTILVGGCESAAPAYVYNRPGATHEQMTRDETECARSAGGGQPSPERVRRCMSDRGYAAQELRPGSYLEIRDMKTRPLEGP